MSTVFSNEELAKRIQNGETDLYADLWQQTRRLFLKMANSYFTRNRELYAASGVEFDDVE